MRKVGWLILIVALVGACDDDDDEDIDLIDVDGNGVPDSAQAPLEPVDDVFEWRAQLAPTSNIYTVTGTSVVRERDDETTFAASVTIRSDVVGAVRPWHVHFGTCASGGDIVGNDADYARLVVGSDGVATGVARVVFELDPDEPYHVNIHKSDAELATIIACGNLDLL